MAYRKRAAPRRKMIPKRRFPAKGPSVAMLAKQVRVLQKKTKQVTERDLYRLTEGIDAASPYVVTNLCNYSTWTKLWASTTTSIADVRSSMYHRYFKIDNLVTLDNVNNEEGTVSFTYMIISRRKEATSATDTGNSLSLSSGVDYAITNGIAFMNLKKYRVHYVKRFTLTGGDGADMQADQCQKRFTATVKVGKKVTNPDGSWVSLTNSPDSTDTYYAVLFNDNSTGDLENPRWSFNCIHSIDN